MSDLTEPQTARFAALDCVLHLFRGQAVEDMPDTASLLAMAQWVLDGTADAAHDVQLLNAALDRKDQAEIRYEEPMRP